jgi:hypothetical protein
MLIASRRPAAVASRLSMQPWFLLAVLVTWPFAGCAIRYEPELSDPAVMPGYSVAEVLSLAYRTLKVEVYGNPFAATPPTPLGTDTARPIQLRPAVSLPPSPSRRP